MKNDRELTIGDLLKSEADRLSRVAIDAPAETKAGQLVIYPPRKEPLVALSNAENGKVLVQPWNCVIYLDNIRESDITSTTFGDESTPLTIELLKQQGDAHGIKYIGTPIAAN